jgi:hypothetical protein
MWAMFPTQHSIPFARSAAAILIAVLVLIGALPRQSAAETTAKVSPSDQVQFQQKAVEAQMQELQDRMFHLADLTRDSEPDDSARLLMAVRKAREDLIIEQMRDALDQLSHQDLSKASEEQTVILTKLEELKKLLTSTDLDLQMQLQRLRQLSQAIAKLDAGIKEEKRQQKQSDTLAKLQKVDSKDLLDPKNQQQQNRKATEAIAETLKDLGPAPAKAGAGLGGACQNMSLAEGHLSGGRPGDAQALQQLAVVAMQKSRDQLEAERQKILDELQGQVRKQVVENLTEMLERQKTIRAATEAVVGRMSSTDPSTQLRVKQLAPAEAAIVRICDQTLELIEQTDFSIALPPALTAVRASCRSVEDRLGSGIADAALVGDEKQIESDLADLLDTFKQLASQPGPPSQCRGCKGNKNKLLAELKVLRMLQGRVDRRTTAIDTERAQDQSSPTNEPSAGMRDKITDISASQDAIHAATFKIHQEISGE